VATSRGDKNRTTTDFVTTTTARPLRGRQVHAWTREQSRSLQVRRVVVTVCRRAVFFNVLPNTRLKTVGLGAVRAVVVTLLVTLTADQAAVRRRNHGTGGVAHKVTVHVTCRQGLGGDRLSCLESG